MKPLPSIPGLVLTGEYPTGPQKILVQAKEKTGKCLSGNALILNPRNGRLTTIRDLVRTRSGEVFSMRESGLLVEMKPAHFFENDPAQLFRLRTQTGREIEATGNHEFLTPDGWKCLETLSEQDRVAVVAEYPTEIFWKAGVSTPDALIKILAYLIADGSLTGGANNPVFTKNDPIVREDFEGAVEESGADYSEYLNNGVVHVRVKRRGGQPNQIVSFLQENDLSGKASAEKFIPPMVFGMRKEQMALFLNRLFTCDGSIERAGKVSYSSTSVRMVGQVQHLLARFGIVSVIRDRYIDDKLYGAELVVSSHTNVVRFVDQIGFIGAKARKAEQMRPYLVQAVDPNSRAGTETQLWRHGPYLWDRVRSIEKALIEPTYDLEITEHHNFVANDFVVHNSSLATTLFGWPTPDDYPLVLGWDENGPESCANLGFQVPNVKICKAPGKTWVEKANNTLIGVEQAKASGQWPFGSIVVDCASTMCESLYAEAKENVKNRDGRAHWGYVLFNALDFFNRVCRLGVSTIWLAWLKEPFIEEEKNDQTGQKTKRMVLGGPNILGNFRGALAGKADMIFTLEKKKVPAGTPYVSSDGYLRLLHTKSWEMIEGGGRWNLPEPIVAHLGYALDLIYGRVPNPAKLVAGASGVTDGTQVTESAPAVVQ